MNELQPPLTEDDYGAIEAAVMETERGRWFLAQYAARNRNSDTTALLDAIKKLERTMQSNTAGAPGMSADQVRFDLVEMAAAIAQTKREIASLRSDDDKTDGIMAATEQLDAIVIATEAATQSILEAAEQVQEVTWTMREDGVNEDYCEAIDKQVTEIYTSCSFQDITGQRTSKVIAVLHYLEDRLEAMRHIWGGDEVETSDASSSSGARTDVHLLNGPQIEGNGHDQGDVDLLMSSEKQLYEAVVTPADTGDETIAASSDASGQETAAEPQETSPDESEPETAADDIDDAARKIISEAVVVEEDADEEPEYEIVETVSPPSAVAQGASDTVRLTDIGKDDKLALFS